MPRYITYVHAIKSASANIGAGDTSRLASVLEDAGLRNDWKFITDNNNKFLDILTKLLKDIKNALLQYDAKSADDNEKDHERDALIQKELKTLKSALDSIDIDAINIAVAALLRLARTEEEKKTIRDISHHVLLFEYDEANELIDSF